MNELGGYEGSESNDALIRTLLPTVGVQGRTLIESIKKGGKSTDGLALFVVFVPDADCRAARLDDIIAMMVRRGEAGIAEKLRTERLGPDEHWLAIQRFEAGGGVIVMARLKFGEVDVAKLLN